MAEHEDPLMPQAESSSPRRRAADHGAPVTPVAAQETDPEFLYAEFRAGRLGIEALAPQLPLTLVFQWHAQRRLSEAEFTALMADLEIHEVKVDDLPAHKSALEDAESQRSDAVVSAFDARMAAFDEVSSQDIVSERDLISVFQAKTLLVDGIGIRLAFARDSEGQATTHGAAPQLSLLCRAFIASTSMQSTVKCEAVFRGAGMADTYCRIVVPMPIHKGGRRRLLVSILDNQTRQPVNLPPALAEIFHEKYLIDLKVLRKRSDVPNSIGAKVKGVFGKLFSK